MRSTWIAAWVLSTITIVLLKEQQREILGSPPPANTGDEGPIPGSGRSPGEGNGNPLQHSCLGNRMERGAWRATVHGVAELDMAEHLHNTTGGVLLYTWEKGKRHDYRRRSPSGMATDHGKSRNASSHQKEKGARNVLLPKVLEATQPLLTLNSCFWKFDLQNLKE